MCWRHEARNGASAFGYADPTALLSATEFASRAPTAALTAGSLRSPFLASAVPVAMPASWTCSSRRYVSPARRATGFVAAAASPRGGPAGTDLLSAGLLADPQAVAARAMPTATDAIVREVRCMAEVCFP